MNKIKVKSFDDFPEELDSKSLLLNPAEKNKNVQDSCSKDIKFLEAESKLCVSSLCNDEKNIALLNISTESEIRDEGKMKLADNHSSDSGNVYVSCRFCRKGFESLKCFEAHQCKREKINSSLKTYKCKFCSLTFSGKNNLNRHVKCHKRNNCYICNAQFTKRRAVCKHLRNEHKINVPVKVYNCSFCSKYFFNKKSLNLHLKSHAKDEYFCLKCGFTCDDKDSYDDHVKIHIKVSKYECKLCGKTFVRRQQYDQHMNGHEKHICSSCNVTFSTKKLLFKHQRSVHHAQTEKKHPCLICDKLFLCPKLLRSHERTHTQEKSVKCSQCDISFSDSKSLSKHMKTIRHLQRASEGKVEIEKRFLCSDCGARFYRRQSLFRHIKILHADNESLKCPHCNYNTKLKTNLKRHIEIHSDVKRFVCEICGSSFHALGTLKQHHAFVHSENREFICNVCKKGFKNNSTLQRHMRIHSKNRPYKCNQCDNDYKRMSHLKRHMVSAHHMTSKKIQIPIIKENTELDSCLNDSNMGASVESSDALSESLCDDSSFSILSTNSLTSSIEVNGSCINGNALKEQLSASKNGICTDVPTINVPTLFDEVFSATINNDSTGSKINDSNMNHKTSKEQPSEAYANDSHYTNVPGNNISTLFDEEFSISATITDSSTCNKINDSNINEHSTLKEQLLLSNGNYTNMPTNTVQTSFDKNDPHIADLNTLSFVSNQGEEKTSCVIPDPQAPLSLDDSNLNLSSNEYCFNLPSSPLGSISIENATLQQSIIAQDILSFSPPSDSLIRPHSLPNLNFQANSPVDAFTNFTLSSSDMSSSMQIPSFLLAGDLPSPSHDLNAEQNHSSKHLFGSTDDILSLQPPYSPNINLGESNCSSEHFLNSAKDMGLWDVDENSNVLKLSVSDVIATSTCANSSFSASLSYNSNNISPHSLFSSDSFTVYSLESIMNQELDTMSNLC